jgi:hypothetical protein
LEYLDLLQWPAMLVTVIAAWLVASQAKRRREAGFWIFLLSNGLWIVWAWHDRAYALIALSSRLPRAQYTRGIQERAGCHCDRRKNLTRQVFQSARAALVRAHRRSGSFEARPSDHRRVRRWITPSPCLSTVSTISF